MDTFYAFLSIPYGAKSQEQIYWKALATSIRNAAKQITFAKLEILSADEHVAELNLKKSVSELLGKCHFTIAVVTEKNPNVFWEIGYTEAQKKPVVYLVREDSQTIKASPVLIVEALKCQYLDRDVKDAIAGDNVPKSLQTKLKPFLEIAIKTVQGTARKPEIICYKKRTEIPLNNLIATANERIHIITTNLSYFMDTEHMFFETSEELTFLTKEKSPFKMEKGAKVHAFEIPAKRGIEIKILTLDPESLIARYRAEQLGFDFDIGYYRKELKDSVKSFYARYKIYNNVSIRLYDDLPTLIALIIDKRVITSVITRGSRARDDLHFLIDLDLPGANIFEAHFAQVASAPSKHISAFKWASIIGDQDQKKE